MKCHFVEFSRHPHQNQRKPCVEVLFKKVKVGKKVMSKIQGMDLEITTAAALRGHSRGYSRGHSSPEKITALPSNRTVNTSIDLINTSIDLINTSIDLINTSIELMQPLHSLSCMHSSQHLILCSLHPKLLRNHLLSCYKRSSLPTRASLAFTCITCIHCNCKFRR